MIDRNVYVKTSEVINYIVLISYSSYTHIGVAKRSKPIFIIISVIIIIIEAISMVLFPRSTIMYT